jgi:hypothetical protein
MQGCGFGRTMPGGTGGRVRRRLGGYRAIELDLHSQRFPTVGRAREQQTAIQGNGGLNCERTALGGLLLALERGKNWIFSHCCAPLPFRRERNLALSHRRLGRAAAGDNGPCNGWSSGFKGPVGERTRRPHFQEVSDRRRWILPPCLFVPDRNELAGSRMDEGAAFWEAPLEEARRASRKQSLASLQNPCILSICFSSRFRPNELASCDSAPV